MRDLCGSVRGAPSFQKGALAFVLKVTAAGQQDLFVEMHRIKRRRRQFCKIS